MATTKCGTISYRERIQEDFFAASSPSLRLAAQVATMDILSNGRIDFGVGRSKNLWQLAPFGVGLEEGRGRMVESLSIIPKILTEEVFSHDGHYYQIPPREVIPKPIQQPHPPMWTACTQEETHELAGSIGIAVCSMRKGGSRKPPGRLLFTRTQLKIPPRLASLSMTMSCSQSWLAVTRNIR